MIYYSVDRKEIYKAYSGEKFKASVKTIPSEEKNTRGLMRILNEIINRRYLGRKR